LFGVHWRVVSKGWWREGPPLRTTHLVVTHDDGHVDDLAYGGSDVRRGLVVHGIDVWCVAEAVGIPGERL
jgi:hypothetical protein